MICAWIETSSADTGSSETMKSGLTRERARDADALPLAARELVRIARRGVGGQADALEQLADARAALAPRPRARATRSGSPTMRPTLCRGLSDANGSWKTICIRRRSGRSSASSSVRDVLAVEHDPPGGRLVEAEDRPPDASTCRSPTRRRARASRRARSSSETPSTALMSPTWRSSTRPLLIGNQTSRSSSSTSARALTRGTALARAHSSSGTGLKHATR